MEAMVLTRKNVRKTPTFKQQRFAEAYVKHKGNGTQAALETYDSKSYNSATIVARDNVHNPVVQKAIQEELNKTGLTIDYLNNKSKRIVDEIHEEGEINYKTLPVATNHLQFLYKLHNAIPANKSMRMSVNMSQDLSQINVIDATKTLKELDLTTKALLEELQS